MNLNEPYLSLDAIKTTFNSFLLTTSKATLSYNPSDYEEKLTGAMIARVCFKFSMIRLLRYSNF